MGIYWILFRHLWPNSELQTRYQLMTLNGAACMLFCNAFFRDVVCGNINTFWNSSVCFYTPSVVDPLCPKKNRICASLFIITSVVEIHVFWIRQNTIPRHNKHKILKSPNSQYCNKRDTSTVIFGCFGGEEMFRRAFTSIHKDVQLVTRTWSALNIKQSEGRNLDIYPIKERYLEIIITSWWVKKGKN